MNLEEMSVKELEDLQQKVSNEIKIKRAQSKKEVLSKIRAIAVAGGYSLEELVSAARSGESEKSVRSVPPKYRHPAQSQLAWTGRGKRPRWVTEWLDSGKPLDDLLIP